MRLGRAASHRLTVLASLSKPQSFMLQNGRVVVCQGLERRFHPLGERVVYNERKCLRYGSTDAERKRGPSLTIRYEGPDAGRHDYLISHVPTWDRAAW
jgi:hypothetical protein